MSAPATSETDKAAASKAFQRKLVNRVSTAVGAIFLVIGLMQIYSAFFGGLPSCASDAAKTGVGSIFKQKNVELTGLTNQKTLTDTRSEETCQADFMTPAEAGTLAYRIYWQGKDPQIIITKVDTHPR